jgi:hypothetical protein
MKAPAGLSVAISVLALFGHGAMSALSPLCARATGRREGNSGVFVGRFNGQSFKVGGANRCAGQTRQSVLSSACVTERQKADRDVDFVATATIACKKVM